MGPDLDMEAGNEFIHLLPNPTGSTIQSVEVPWPSVDPR